MHKIKVFPVLATAIVSLGCGPWSVVAQSANVAPNNTLRLPMAETRERMFLNRAEAGCVANILMAKLAISTSKDKEVLSLAQGTLDNHTKMSKDRKLIFEAKNMAPGKAIRWQDYETYKSLKVLTGVEFDRAYIKFVAEEDREEADAFRTQIVWGPDDLKEHVRSGEAMLRTHSLDADSLAKARGVEVVLQTPQSRLLNH